MKAGRRPPKRAGRSGRSPSRAVTALAVMGGLVLLYGWNSFFLAPRGRAKAAVAKELSAARTQEQTLRQNLAQLRRLADDTKSREAELTRLGRLVLLGDPGRNYFNAQGLEERARYEIPTSLQLENRGMRETVVWRVLPDPC